MRIKLLILGATGNIGRVLADLLVKNPTIEITALTRNVDSAYQLKQLGINSVIGDLSDIKLLNQLTLNVEKVFLNSTLQPDMVEKQCAVIDACRDNGVQHIVLVSSFGAGHDNSSLLSKLIINKWHTEVEVYLENSGIDYTHLRPNYFMQNLLHYQSEIVSTGQFSGHFGEGRISMIDVNDIAAVASTVLLDDQYRNRSFELTGPQALTMEEVANYLSQKNKRMVHYRDISLGQLRELLISVGFPDWAIEAIVSIQTFYRQDFGATITDSVEKVTKQIPRSFQNFTKQYF